MADADYFSNLPDNIITKIFSHLTMKESMGICISCKKLMHLRTTIPHLEFKESVDDSFNLLVDMKKRNLVKSIDQFLKNHDCPIQTFKLSFYPDWYAENVFSWISLVMQRGPIELDLNFLPTLGVPIRFPSYLLNSKSLQVLKLRSCVLESPSDISCLSSLKSLFLRDLTLSDDMVEALLCQSGMLQNLILENCKGFESINVTDINSKLDYLSLENCGGVNYLFAPCVRALSICIGNIDVFVIGTSQLRDAVLVPKSSVSPSKREARNRTAEVLEIMSFFADNGEEQLKHWEYVGVVKLEQKTYSCNFRELLGHSWVLTSGCVEKIVISMIEF